MFFLGYSLKKCDLNSPHSFQRVAPKADQYNVKQDIMLLILYKAYQYYLWLHSIVRYQHCTEASYCIYYQWKP